jgi:hypothetical protein
VSEALFRAGIWTRRYLSPACIEYLVANDYTAYWLHLAVLGNPRISARTAEDGTFETRAAIIRWLTPGGLPYAIAEPAALPRDVRTDLDVVVDFGTAVVVKRRGRSSCPNTQPPQNR